MRKKIRLTKTVQDEYSLSHCKRLFSKTYYAEGLGYTYRRMGIPKVQD